MALRCRRLPSRERPRPSVATSPDAPGRRPIGMPCRRAAPADRGDSRHNIRTGGIFHGPMRNSIVRLRCIALAILIATPWPVVAAEGAASGIFLVASPAIRDPNFSEAVVLVTQPQRGGPVGVIINRPLNRRLKDVLPEVDALKGKADLVYFGGPVAREGLVFLVRSAGRLPRAMRVLGDIYLTGDRKTIEKLMRRPDPTQGVRVYAGYSGWASRQLRDEIKRGDWYLLPADAETIFEPDATRIWPKLVQRAALREIRAAAPARRVPAARRNYTTAISKRYGLSIGTGAAPLTWVR